MGKHVLFGETLQNNMFNLVVLNVLLLLGNYTKTKTRGKIANFDNKFPY